ncbi:2,3-bisphosphoglycerate-independent phosphoglycerate mutase [Methanohalophilus levihalophilus]|uniref:cofactor-independent phosphoglycerate mutase n=1 Tax=Methanohalophilus levihalophilus TaxID=1431282 RepID=UPI001AE84E2C|nr:cofactor-independent phosphoglycerate mutase [Methanohalophilus levihalophilus]MBP2030083.1 2,3-bisphosphoglycerate-independent phosphoglycerate mutase [Methanohalophilus levihalophilus]
MKYVVLIGDGMADHPIESLGGNTILEAASTPNMDKMAMEGACGLANNVPEGYPAGSDVANMSVLGYDPRKYYSGRAPLEAASMGVSLKEGEVAFRCNLITIENGLILDHSAGHISSGEAAQLIEAVEEELGNDVHFYPGFSYRHLMTAPFGVDCNCTPPHDVLEQPVKDHMPKGEASDELGKLIEASWDILAEHPVNIQRIKEGKKPANSIWFWGQGYAPEFPMFYDLYGLTASVISAVDLIKGLGVYAGMEVLDVPGATGYLDTNYAGKVGFALKALENHDAVFVHVEAPDEAGHMGNIEAKIQAVEDFDGKIVGPILEGVEDLDDDCIVLVLPDHPTPIALRTHTSESVPFVVWSTADFIRDEVTEYTEEQAADGSLGTVEGNDLIDLLVELGEAN